MKPVLPMIYLVVTAFTGTAMADPSSYCGNSGAAHWTTIRDTIVGRWAITHHSGYAVAGGMVMPFPADTETEVLSIALRGGVLEASHPEMRAPMVMLPADATRWVMETDDPAMPKPTLTLSDLELAVGCDQMALPRIIGTTSAVVDGNRMDFVNRLIVVDAATLYGVMEMTTIARGTPVLALRTVSLIRQSN